MAAYLPLTLFYIIILFSITNSQYFSVVMYAKNFHYNYVELPNMMMWPHYITESYLARYMHTCSYDIMETDYNNIPRDFLSKSS